jgi:hypothetical protein
MYAILCSINVHTSEVSEGRERETEHMCLCTCTLVYFTVNLRGGYQPRSNLVKDENGDLLADSNTILNRWKSYFSQLLNVDDVSDVRQIEIHTAEPEPLVPGPSHLEVEISIAKLKKYKSPGSVQILAELYQAGGETLVSVIHKLIT